METVLDVFVLIYETGSFFSPQYLCVKSQNDFVILTFIQADNLVKFLELKIITILHL